MFWNILDRWNVWELYFERDDLAFLSYIDMYSRYLQTVLYLQAGILSVDLRGLFEIQACCWATRSWPVVWSPQGLVSAGGPGAKSSFWKEWEEGLWWYLQLSSRWDWVMRLGYISVKLRCFPGGVKPLSREVPSVSAVFCPSPSALASYLDGLLLFLHLHN